MNKMDIITIILWIALIYVFWILIEAISSLQSEVREMKLRCVDDESEKNTKSTKEDIKKTLTDKFSNMTKYIKDLL